MYILLLHWHFGRWLGSLMWREFKNKHMWSSLFFVHKPEGSVHFTSLLSLDKCRHRPRQRRVVRIVIDLGKRPCVRNWTDRKKMECFFFLFRPWLGSQYICTYTCTSTYLERDMALHFISGTYVPGLGRGEPFFDLQYVRMPPHARYPVLVFSSEKKQSAGVSWCWEVRSRSNLLFSPPHQIARIALSLGGGCTFMYKTCTYPVDVS